MDREKYVCEELNPVKKGEFGIYMSSNFKELKLSQKKLAEELSLDERTIRGYLNGEHQSDYRTQQDIVSYINRMKTRDVGGYRYIEDKDFLELLETLDKKLRLSELLSQAELSEIFGISQSEYSKNGFFRSYSIYEQYDILTAIYGRIYAGQRYGRKIYTNNNGVIGRELSETLKGNFTFSSGSFTSITAILKSEEAVGKLPGMPEKVSRFLYMVFLDLQRSFDYPFNPCICYFTQEKTADYYIKKLDELMKFRTGFNSEDNVFTERISKIFPYKVISEWVAYKVRNAQVFMGGDRLYILEYLRENEEIRNMAVTAAYNMLGENSRYHENPPTDDDFKRYSVLGNAKHCVFSKKLCEFKKLPLKIQELILENINAFCPPCGENGEISYLTVRFMYKYRLLCDEDKAMIKERLETIPSVSIASHDFDVIADCRAMVKLAPKVSGLWKKDTSKKAEERIAENYREFCKRAEMYLEGLINIMASVEAKLSFTAEEWYIWMLAENALRADKTGIIYYLFNMMEGDFTDENEISDEELKKFGSWLKQG